MTLIKNHEIDEICEMTSEKLGLDTLERYTGSRTKNFQPYVLITNFPAYVDAFSQISGKPVTKGTTMTACHCEDLKISIINFGIGSPMGALIIELLSYTKPKAVLFLGMCGGLRKEYQVGDYLNPVAAIREEGTSFAYMPKRCPSLSSFVIQRYVCEEIERRKLKYHSGVIHTTNVRFWELKEKFKAMLAEERSQAIDMECATLFTVGFAKYVPVGALMLISDLPLKRGGIKTKSSTKKVFEKYTSLQIEMGVEILRKMQHDAEKGLGYQF